jgi:hypothetical protein
MNIVNYEVHGYINNAHIFIFYEIEVLANIYLVLLE